MDWIAGYGPPPERYLEYFQNVLAGKDTYVALSERYVKEPNNVEVILKLARKYEGRSSMQAKAKELYNKVLALDPDGKSGSLTDNYEKWSVPYTQVAEFSLAQYAFSNRKPDPAPFKAFIAKYPDPQSPLLKYAYFYLVNYYKYSAPQDAASKDEGTKFFEEYVAKYPHDASVLNSYVEKIIKDKEPIDKGIELAEKVKGIQGYPVNPAYAQNLAQLYDLKGAPDKADQEYGKDFIDGYVTSTVRALTGYANYWLERSKNLESAEAMADTAAKMAPDESYTLQRLAEIYAKLKKPDKAVGIYGPEFAKKNEADAYVLYTYAEFWSRQGQNLESALGAAKKSTELGPEYYSYYTLATILLRMKKYDEALMAAEKAVELAKLAAAGERGFPTRQYEDLVKKIRDARGK